jgi:hypothetical protein
MQTQLAHAEIKLALSEIIGLAAALVTVTAIVFAAWQPDSWALVVPAEHIPPLAFSLNLISVVTYQVLNQLRRPPD